VGRRFSVAGTSGAGKSTVGRAIASRLDLPYFELDSLFHGPNWSEPPPGEFQRRVLASIDGLDGWVVDGNYHSKLDELVLERADTFVWLDLPLRVSLRRIWRRTWSRILRREELWAGNRERIWTAFVKRESLVHWAVKSHFRHRREFPDLLERHPQLEVVRLRSPRDVERWLDSL
jgi:adenylate kinase family enzyme